MKCFRRSFLAAALFSAVALRAALPPAIYDYTDKYCSSCHNDEDKKGRLDLTSLPLDLTASADFAAWIKVHDRLNVGEMPPKEKKRPDAAETAAFLAALRSTLVTEDRALIASEGRATQRRLNGYEYENALRDLLSAPWLQIRGQFPEDGESNRFNKVGDALDVSHVHMARYMGAADYAMRQALTVQLEQVPTTTTRYYARDQRTLTAKFTPNPFNSSPDRMTYPLLLREPQHAVRMSAEPITVGASDPAKRELEAVGWVSSNYVTGFTYRWDGFRAPVAGRYRIRFSGYTMWAAPGGIVMSFSNGADKVGKPRPPNMRVPNYDNISAGRTNEPITVYTRNGLLNRRVGEFDLTPEPAVYDLGETWLLANETLVPDASRFYRSRPNDFRNPLMTAEGVPSVAFRWMEVEGPLKDDSTTAGYRLLFGDLPLKKVAPDALGLTVPVVAHGDRREGGRNAGQRVEALAQIRVDVVSAHPHDDAERLLRTFLARAYRRPVVEADVQRFVALVDDRLKTGSSFIEAMFTGYTAVLASPAFVFLDEKPGRLDDYALATRLSLFLWNSPPDDALRARAARGEIHRPEVLRSETERMLNDPKSRRFREAFLDYWIDLRKIEDSTPSTMLYNDYYLDDALTEAAVAETQLTFEEMVHADLPVRGIVDANYTYLNERLATHYGIHDVKGTAMRRVILPADSPRGGFMTQASVLKITANGTTTSPVLRGKWIVERILGIDIPPPPPIGVVEPDIRGAVTIRQQLEKHRADASCASCHRKMDPPGFALESFDVMGGWRDHYRGADDTPVAATKPADKTTDKKFAGKGIGKNGQPFDFYFALPVDAAGELPDGRPFKDIREFKRMLRTEDVVLARNLTHQFLVYATGAPMHFSDREQVERIISDAKAHDYGVRSLIHGIVQSDLFQQK
jgi:hypothetical protein